uniref:Uncharacterized protein n=1 Tax=Octopus bimaculoides TaxID=37653 RepID=A0A0L8I2L8_OCTBM
MTEKDEIDDDDDDDDDDEDDDDGDDDDNDDDVKERKDAMNGVFLGIQKVGRSQLECQRSLQLQNTGNITY